MSPPTLRLAPVDAVVFDLDGVLVDSSHAVRRHWFAFAARCGLDGDDLLDAAHGRPSRDTIARFVPDQDNIRATLANLAAAAEPSY